MAQRAPRRVDGHAGQREHADHRKAFETEHTGPVTITHSPFTDGSETLDGYVIADVADRAEAVELAKTWPTGETIEVRPIWTPP